MLVSVIIPCFNVQAHVKDAVQSAIQQTYSPLEIICVDNNSTDGTMVVLEELKQAYPSLVIDQELKPGASAARNKGLNRAKGEWIQFLDADDLLFDNKIERQINIIKQNPESIMVVGSYHILNPDGSKQQFIVSEGNKWKNLMEGSLGCTISNLFHRKSVISAGGWDEEQKSSQEYKLMFDILKTNPNAQIAFDYEAGAIYQKRSEGSISNNLADNIMRFIVLRNKIWNFLTQTGVKDVDENYYLNTVFHKIRLLYQFDNSLAVSMNKSMIHSSFVPNRSVVTPKHYIFLYRLLGFSKTEKLLSKMKSLV